MHFPIKAHTTLFAATLALAFAFSSSSHAVPKAAEHENAPVTYGADTAKPKPASKPSQSATTAKSKSAAKAKPATTPASPQKKTHKAAGKKA